MDSVGQDKYTYAKVVPSPTKENNGVRKPFIAFRRPRRTRGSVIMLCVVVLSLFLVVCLSLAFVGADAVEGYFKKALDVVARNDPGVSVSGCSRRRGR